jgi:Xaa-Pro dipeptidase
VNEELSWRATRLRAAMAEQGLDGLLAFAPGWRRENVRYLTGASLREAFAFAFLPAEGEVTAFVTSAEDERSVQMAGWAKEVVIVDAFDLSALGGLGERPDRLGVAHLELMPDAIAASVASALPRTELVSATRLMDLVRLVKSDWELEQTRRAGKVCSAAWEALVGSLRPGIKEYEIVAEVEAEIKRLGGRDNFMLFASGGAEVMGMTPPGRRELQVGDMVRTELTPQLGGYYAQICRSAVLGTPSASQRASFELFNEALQAGLDALHAGVSAHEVAKAENDVFRKHGYGEYTTSAYTRVRGHGHGLHPDEIPSLLEGEETVIEENAVIIVHPNTYTPIAGYHVLGDPVVVTKSGYEPLLSTERVLFSAPV